MSNIGYVRYGSASIGYDSYGFVAKCHETQGIHRRGHTKKCSHAESEWYKSFSIHYDVLQVLVGIAEVSFDLCWLKSSKGVVITQGMADATNLLGASLVPIRNKCTDSGHLGN